MRVQRHRARTEQVPHRRECYPHRADAHASARRDGLEPGNRALGVIDRVQRQGRHMTRETMAVRAARVFLLQTCAVEQQHFGQIARRGGAPYRALIALAHQHRQPAAVVEVGVTQHHAVQATRVHRKRVPFALAQRLAALVQATVEHDLAAAHLDEMA